MWRLTRQEQWTILVVVLLFLGGIAGRAWIGSLPPATDAGAPPPVTEE